MQALAAAPKLAMPGCRAPLPGRALALAPLRHHPQPRRVQRQRPQQQRLVATQAFLSTDTLVGLAIFFSPSVAALIYAYIKGKGNLTDGLSRLLTDVSQVGMGLGRAQRGPRQPPPLLLPTAAVAPALHPASPSPPTYLLPPSLPSCRATSSPMWAARTSRWRRASCLTWRETSRCSRRCTSGELEGS